MGEIRYLISDASKKVDVESHVLRYWEEELDLHIPRNDMGHRYYTELHIRLFQKIKELKEKGYQLKAIKTVLGKMIENNGELDDTDGLLEEDAAAALKEGREEGDGLMDAAMDPEGTSLAFAGPDAETRELSALTAEDRMEQFRQIMGNIIGQALEKNNQKLSQDISRLVNDKMSKELEYLMRVSDEREDERFKQLDETIRAYQKESKGRAEAAAAKVKTPFFKRRKFWKDKGIKK